MGRTTSTVKKLVLDELRVEPKGKKELKSIVKAKGASLKKNLKKAIKQLVKAGAIVKSGEKYLLKDDQNTSNDEREKELQKIEQQETNGVSLEALPIGARLRRQEQQEQNKSVSFNLPEDDIDDEIRRLEMELQKDDSSDESDSDSEDAGPAGGVLSLSEFAQDRIEQLPETHLPEPGRYNPRANPGPLKKSKKAKRQDLEEKKRKDGLKEAVQEVLSGYKARSSERLPFYCRFCSKQYEDEQSFFEHKSLDFHKTAVEMERRSTYCRLCMKQLTSPAQMKEHLTSRPHKERLHTVRERQRAESKFGKRKRGQSGRQWS